MKITFSVEELSSYLQIVNSTVPSRTTKSSLSCVLIEVDKNHIFITGTDLEVGVRCQLEEVKSDGQYGQFVVSANRLAGICHEIGSGSLEFKGQNGQVHLTSKGANFKLPIEAPEDFPELNFQAEACGVIETDDFCSLIQKTSFATASERSRFAINGVHFQIKDHILSLTATDGRRLANAKAEVKGKIKELTAIVPARALLILQKVLISTGQREVVVEMDDNQIVLHTPKVSIMARLISGRFPDYESVIPKKNDNIFVIKKENFEKIIRSAALVTSEDSRSILLNLSSGRLSASARTQVHGESNISGEVDYDGGDLEIRFNPTYLLEGVKVCDTDQIQFALKDDRSAGLLQEKGGSSYRYVVTPINLVS